jgi:hypothetical protein
MGQTRVKPVSQFEVKHKLEKLTIFGNQLYQLSIKYHRNQLSRLEHLHAWQERGVILHS